MVINFVYILQMMDEDELFNSEYVEVDRVLGVSRFPPIEGTDEPEAVYYLVKWRQLPYEDATWELEADVDKTRIAKYLEYASSPSKLKVVFFNIHFSIGYIIVRPTGNIIKSYQEAHDLLWP